MRGTVPDQIDEELARAVGSRLRRVTGPPAARSSSATTCGRPRRGWPRPSPTARAAAGADVTLIGLASTDELYFASGHLGLPGAMFTASHNPAQYNGIKMCRADAAPLGADTGLAAVRDLVAAGGAGRRRDGRGTVVEQRPARRRTPTTCCRLAPVDRAAGSRSSSTPATGWPGTPCRRCSAGCDLDARAALLRARRHLPEPRGQPDRAGQPGRPAGEGARDRRRHRAGLRRRRRPLLPGRRARRGRQPVGGHRADRRRASWPGSPARR